MAFKEVSACFVLLCSCLLAGCSGDTSANNPPTVDQIKAAEHKNVQTAENDSHLSPQMRAEIEAHNGGGPSSEAAARSGDLRKH